MEQEPKTNESLTVFASLGEVVKANRALIQDKVSRALAACSAVTKVSSEDENKFANDLLVKCNATLPVVEELRKAYTKKLDEWKAGEMQLEKQLKDEIDRIKKLRDVYEQDKHEKANAERTRIEKAQKKEHEIGRVKAELVAAVELGVGNRLLKGEEALAKLFNDLTLETIGGAEAALSFPPTLKEEFFNGLVTSFDAYDKTLLTVEEIAELKAKALKHFDYPKRAAKYVELVRDIQKTWKEKIPARKRELEEIAKADASKAEELKAQAAERSRKEELERQAQGAELAKTVGKQRDEAMIDTTVGSDFSAQMQIQRIDEAQGRKKVVFRFVNEEQIAQEPGIVLASILSKVILHVITDKDYAGIFKREKLMPKRDAETGLLIYTDEVQGWLDELAKIKPTPVIQGLESREIIKTIAKKDKAKPE